MCRWTYSLVVCYRTNRKLHAARDPIGLYPLYWAATGETIFFSTSPDRLVAEPGVSGEVNRAALADLLRHHFPDIEETYLAAVMRVPPGHLLRLTESGKTSKRYWHPA